MEGTDGAQKSSETLSRIRIEQVAGSLENHPEGMCTVTCITLKLIFRQFEKTPTVYIVQLKDYCNR